MICKFFFMIMKIKISSLYFKVLNTHAWLFSFRKLDTLQILDLMPVAKIIKVVSVKIDKISD